MDWLNDIPATVTKDGDLKLMPKNSEHAKTVKDVAPAFKEAADYIIKNKFPGVLN